MTDPGIAGPLPAGLKAAAGLLVLYGIVMVLNATVMSGAMGWTAGRELPWAIARLAAALVVAWGLLRRARWAWWLGVALVAFWLVTGAAVVLVLQRGDLHWLPPSRLQLFLVGSLLSLGLCLALLLSPRVRAAFRDGRS